MARNYAQVKVSIWDQYDFIDLDPDAQRLYFVLMTRAELNLAGVIEWRPGRLAELSKGTTKRHVEVAAGKLEASGFIVIDRETEECALRTAVRHDEVLERGPKLAAGVVSAWRTVYSRRLRTCIAAEVQKMEGLSAGVQKVIEPLIQWAIANPSDTPPDTPSDTTSGWVSGQPATSNQQPADSCSSADADERVFEEWWGLYPRKVGKGQAKRAFRSALKKADLETLTAAIQDQTPRLMAKGAEFCPHAATWLNGERWLDEAAVEPELTVAQQMGWC